MELNLRSITSECMWVFGEEWWKVWSVCVCVCVCVRASVSKSFRTGRLERELQMVQLSATRCSCIAILWVSLVSFAARACARAHTHTKHPRGCIQKFPDWTPGTRTTNGKAVCQKLQLYSYFVSQSSEFYRQSPLCCFSMSKRIFRYRLSPETFG
jgi:hypothetical protein